MDKHTRRSAKSNSDRMCLPLVGGLILFSVVLGTTSLGFVPVPTEVKHVTTMHLPTIIASLLEGTPVGMFVGAVFGVTSMYMAGSPMVQDPFVAILPRIMVGVTPYLIYKVTAGRNEHLRVGLAAVGGTLTNTILVLGMGVIRGYITMETALSVAVYHGGPEVLIAILIVIPAMIVLRKAKKFLNGFTQ